MAWNYRVYRETSPSGEVFYTLRSAHYRERGDPEPCSYSTTPMYPSGETLDELRADLKRMLASLDKPTLEVPQVSSVRFNASPDIYVPPVFIPVGDYRVAVFDSFRSYCLTSQCTHKDLILVAVAPELYWNANNNGVSLQDHPLHDEFHTLGFRFETAPDVHVQTKDGSYTHAPVWRIAEENFVYLKLRYAP